MVGMDGDRKRPPMTARQWLLVVGGGVVIALFGQVALGALLGAIGLGGLAWRLVGDR